MDTAQGRCPLRRTRTHRTCAWLTRGLRRSRSGRVPGRAFPRRSGRGRRPRAAGVDVGTLWSRRGQRLGLSALEEHSTRPRAAGPCPLLGDSAASRALHSKVPAPSSSRFPSCAEAHGRLLIGGQGSRVCVWGGDSWLQGRLGKQRVVSTLHGDSASERCPRGTGPLGHRRAGPRPRGLLPQPELGDRTCGPPSAPTTPSALPTAAHQARPHPASGTFSRTAPSRPSSHVTPSERL